MANVARLDFGSNHEPGLFARIRDAIADYRAYAALLGELQRMSDRELLDLNLSRASIRDIARQSVYGR